MYFQRLDIPVFLMMQFAGGAAIMGVFALVALRERVKGFDGVLALAATSYVLYLIGEGKLL